METAKGERGLDGNRMTRNCDQCGASYRTYPSVLKKRKGRFCSKACYTTNQTAPTVTRVCESCGEPFTIPGHKMRSRQRFCGQRCHGVENRGRKNAQFVGHTLDASGYMLVFVPDEERARHSHGFRQGRYMFEHVYKAEKALGRCMRRTDVVHHINCDSTDNRNENLLICTRGYHSWLHWEMSRRFAAEKFERVA